MAGAARVGKGYSNLPLHGFWKLQNRLGLLPFVTPIKSECKHRWRDINIMAHEIYNRFKVWFHDYCSKRKERRTKEPVAWSVKNATWALAFLTVGLIIAGLFQYQVLSGTLNELQAEQRPWVSFELPQIQLISGLEHNVNGGAFTIHFPIHNIGKQPAVSTTVKTNVEMRTSNSFLNRQRAFIRKLGAQKPPDIATAVLFTNDDTSFDITMTISKNQLSSSKFIWPSITACIVYCFFESTVPHLTCMTLTLTRNGGRLISADDQAIMVKDLGLTRDPMGPEYAD